MDLPCNYADLPEPEDADQVQSVSPWDVHCNKGETPHHPNPFQPVQFHRGNSEGNKEEKIATNGRGMRWNDACLD